MPEDASPLPRAGSAAPPAKHQSWWRWVLFLPVTMARNARTTWREHRVLFISIGFTCAFMLAYLWSDVVVKIGAGQAGVLYRLFRGGTVVDHVYSEGVHLVAPWNTMFVYNVRVEEVPVNFVALTEDGLEVKVEVSVRYKPHFEQLGLLHKTYGPDYVEKIVKPEVQAEFRFVIGHYTPNQIYESTGFIMQTVVQGVLGQLTERYVELDDVLIKSIQLPKSVAESIESKLRAQQLSLEMKYRIVAEKEEADRKREEAKGIRDFQDTITGGGISQEFLRFKGIEATLELAKSPNSKTIIIGGSDHLPLIFNASDATPVSPLVPSSAPPASPLVPPSDTTPSPPAPTAANPVAPAPPKPPHD